MNLLTYSKRALFLGVLFAAYLDAGKLKQQIIVHNNPVYTMNDGAQSISFYPDGHIHTKFIGSIPCNKKSKKWRLRKIKRALYNGITRALANDNIALLDALLRVKPNAMNFIKKIPLLHLAAGAGAQKSVQFLLEHNFEVNQKDHNGRTPLFYAIMSPKVSKILLSHNADVNVPHSEGIIHCAIWMNALASLKNLLDHPDTNLFQRNALGKTPLALVEALTRSGQNQDLNEMRYYLRKYTLKALASLKDSACICANSVSELGDAALDVTCCCTVLLCKSCKDIIKKSDLARCPYCKDRNFY